MIGPYEQDTGHQIHCTAGFGDVCTCDQWVTPDEYLRRHAPMMAPLHRVVVNHRTRRTVTVATRKYRARRRRR